VWLQVVGILFLLHIRESCEKSAETWWAMGGLDLCALVSRYGAVFTSIH
jgi:hypothetical protein